MQFDYDVFLNHASEDKDAVAKPLHECLSAKNIKVWLDLYQLTIGDSLRQEIDKGLARSEFAVAILSSSFFEKPWALSELDALFALEKGKGNKKRILPILHEIAFDDVLSKSPLLAGKLFGSTKGGIAALCDQILRSIRPAVAASADTRIPFSHRLNEQAVELLVAAEAGGGIIRETSTDQGGYLIRCGAKAFHNGEAGMAAHRRKQELHEALRQLVAEQYVEFVADGQSGTAYELTLRGHQLCDVLRNAL